jgi:hypothetical protein
MENFSTRIEACFKTLRGIHIGDRGGEVDSESWTKRKASKLFDSLQYSFNPGCPILIRDRYYHWLLSTGHGDGHSRHH